MAHPMKRARAILATGLAVGLAWTGAVVAGLGPAAAAESPALIASFTFDDVDTGFSGAGATATVQGTRVLGTGADGTPAAQLSNTFWLDVKKDDGSALLAGLDDVTISYDSAPAANGNVGWTVSAQRSAATHTFQNEHYLGVLDKPGSLVVERYDNAGTRVMGGNLSATGTPAGWKHVDIVVSGATARLYVDGRLLVTNTQGKLLSTILGSSGGVLQLGKASWGANGEYFAGLLDNVRIYDGALTERQVVENAATWVLDSLASSERRISNRTVVLPHYDGAVTWSAPGGSGVVVAADGHTATVDLPTKTQGDQTVQLTAAIGDESVTVPVVLVAVAPLDALVIPARISQDLPSTVLGRDVTWDDGRGGQVVAPDGSVTRPAAGGGALSIHLRAAVEGESAGLEADVQVLDRGGELASYVKTVTLAGGVKDDPLAYDDDRRADALFVSARPAGAADWEPLNRNQAILHVRWDGAQPTSPQNQMGSPSFFRTADGSLGAVASQNNATGSVYVWVAADGATFTGQRLVTVATNGVVRDPLVTYDAARGAYRVAWTDADGNGQLTTLTSLQAGGTPSAATPADVRTLGVTGAGLPDFAAQASTFSLSATEFETFYDNYVDLQNTGVQAVPELTVPEDGPAVTAAQLPGQVTMEYNDGSTKGLDVVWDADDLAGVDTSEPGTYVVDGQVQQGPTAMINDARADPDLFFNEDDGYWYLTGSHFGQPSGAPMDERTSYRKIGLKRSKTLAGLADAEEVIVIDPDAGTPGLASQYPNTYYGWGGWIWAQEFHKINDTWYILAAMNHGYQATGAFPDSMVLIPYTGDDASIRAGGMLDKGNWGVPVVLQNSPGFDVSYMEREEAGGTQGYYVIPKNNTLYVAKATMGPKGTVPQFAGPQTAIYSQSYAWEVGKRAPTPADDNEGTDQAVVEGPFMFEYGDHVFITYSGGTVDKFYTLGLLRADRDADLADPASWTNVGFPVLSTNDTYQGRIGGTPHAGTGHDSLAVDAAGNVVLAYHARPYPEPHTGSAAGGLIDQDRNTWIKPVNVRSNGMLDLTLDEDQEVAEEFRTVTVTVVVEPKTQKPETQEPETQEPETEPSGVASLSVPVFSRSWQPFDAVDAVSVSTVVEGASGSVVSGSVEFREGSVVLARGTVSGGRAVAVLPERLAVGSHRVTAYLATSGSTSAAASPLSGVFTVHKATLRSLRLKAGKTFEPRRAVTIRVAVGLLDSGRTAMGRVVVRVGSKEVSRASVARLASRGGKVVIPARLVKGRKLRIRAQFVPSSSATVQGRATAVILTRGRSARPLIAD